MTTAPTARADGPIVLDDTGAFGSLHAALVAFFDTRPHADLAPELVDELSRLVLGGGKRVRPTFAWWGWRAAGGASDGPDADATVRALVALELLQGCAVVHDDVMDRSTTRRGRPAAHVRFAAHHQRARWAGDGRVYGDSAAILVGDLALAWADDALVTAGLDGAALARAWVPWQAVRTEMMAGQHLDLLACARREESLERTLRVARFKTAAYTVERPLHLGAALAGAPADLIDALREFGRDIGVAFQLRDDLLGVFGDAETIGKPVGDDLREGKRTPLMAVAIGLARAAGRADSVRLLHSCLDGPHVTEQTVADVRDLLHDLGAVEAVEEQIAVLTSSALRALDHARMTGQARAALRRLATLVTARRS
ncbi:polyprenyl synthetase family protein [Umezawaea sp. Da 62-37]|uniref:polyprenyl synthetase family protein n=1 Tax=Umezawaea sp. Da 62-37 TaxID=3075927 RepID=UPI0028F70DC2|nr:polyprenyl synthetase family protein [Umezawaea sp. Da 62-37]WNV88278.1 polyprenyl synthetase family protein [Umezawaea sp. Da 62-37]